MDKEMGYEIPTSQIQYEPEHDETNNVAVCPHEESLGP